MSEAHTSQSLLDKAASVCVMLAALALTWHVVSEAVRRMGDDTARRDTVRSQRAIENVDPSRYSVSLLGAPRLGTADSRLALIEYSDFECPFCQRHARETFGILRRDFIDTGRLVYAYRHLPLTDVHSRGLELATIAQCAESQGRFWDMYGLLFDRPRGAAAGPRDHALKLGLNLHRFEACLLQPATKIAGDIAEAKRLQITATPTFLLGLLGADGTVAIRRRINGARSVDVFASAVEDLLNTESP